VDNVNFLAHYIIGNETIIVNVNEMSTTPHSKFGNGIIKEGEEEEVRIWLQICNENGGREVLPFEGMLPGDAFLWSKYRDDERLMRKFVKITENKFDLHRGYYGTVGDRCIIKNCEIIKDARIGSDAYLKGANKIKNITINSSSEATTQIGEGCELVNGIIGAGCRVFYGVKAVRFIMASFSNLKYGARLINSYLGNNATVSCCEVLNSLIFPAHEQHHNNSFLTAATIMGQSNIAAGATIGSNHNSRGPDGELIAGRGFWPGLCVSLKHNSQFASFALIAKGDYPFEINLPIPFSLLINEVSINALVIMPGYWFLYNMYGLARNSWKYPNRDKRIDQIQQIEYDYLAPDSVEEMFFALALMEHAVGEAFIKKTKQKVNPSKEEIRERGRYLLLNDPDEVKKLTVLIDGVENSKRPTELIKVEKAYPAFLKMIFFYGIREMVEDWNNKEIQSFSDLQKRIAEAQRTEWVNVGGQLISEPDLQQLKTDIKKEVIDSWHGVHERYRLLGNDYCRKKSLHALASLMDIKETPASEFNKELLKQWLKESLEVAQWIQDQVERTRVKDYKNQFRKMVYDNKKEMENVIGKLKDDTFIVHTQQKTQEFEKSVKGILKRL
jgi:hypothetical protein